MLNLQQHPNLSSQTITLREREIFVLPLVAGVVGGGIGEVDGDDGVVGGVEVLAGDVEGLVGDALGAEVELDGAELALAVAVAGVAVAGEAHGHGAVAGEGDEAEAVGDELVVEDGGVDLDLDQVDGDGRDLSNHHAPQRVRHARVGVSELELQEVVLHLPDLHLREPLVRFPFHFLPNLSLTLGFQINGFFSLSLSLSLLSFSLYVWGIPF